jgi:cytosine/adenosine deaminase-related metal-dependent hydrolase
MVLFLARYMLPISAPPLEDGALLVRDGRIVAIGKSKEMTAAHCRAAVVDFGESILLPPLVNAHTHLELTHFPRWARNMEGPEPDSFIDWILQVIRVKRRVAKESYFSSLKEGIQLALAAGTGAVGDILSCFPARQAYRNASLKGRLYLETLGRDPAVVGNLGAVLKEERVGEMELGISPHSPYTLSSQYLEEILEFSRNRKIPVTMHLAESPDEAAFFRDSGGPLTRVLYPFVGWEDAVPPPGRCTPVAYLAKHGGLACWNLLSHGVQVTADDAELLARAGTTVVLCPRSNARLRVGKAPVGLYQKAGVPLALGTDSLASSDSLSLWDELAFAHSWFEGRITPSALLEMATLRGARALGLSGEMGVLQTGWGGHFQVLIPPNLPPIREVEDFLCSFGRTAEVASLYLDGRDVLQRG